MKKYVLYENKIDDNAFLICLTFESIIDYIDEIQNEEIIKKGNGKVIIDQLLVTGDGKNRFLECDYFERKMILSSAREIIGDTRMKKITSDYLRENYNSLGSNILTNTQKEKILNGHDIDA